MNSYLKALLLAFLLLGVPFLQISIAQKHDNIWVSGYWLENECFKPNCQTRLFFQSDSTVTSFWFKSKSNVGRNNSSICDSSGNLKYYTNGFTIFGSEIDTIFNGDRLSLGSYYNYLNGLSLAYWYESLFLPLPSSKQEYILFHSSPTATNFENIAENTLDSVCYFSLVRNDSVIEKNINFIGERTSSNSWNAVKHANGRDWWIVKFADDPKFIWRILLTPQGISEAVKVELNYNPGFEKSWGSPIKFSGLGDKMVAYFWSTPQVIFECSFDRCNGSFSNEKTTSVLSLLQNNYPMYQTLFNPDDPNFKPEMQFYGGIELSPNGRYLYLSFYYLLYQFDLGNSNWLESPYLVDELIIYEDSIRNDEFRYYLTLQNGPNGKTYITQGNNKLSFAVINNPNKLGIECSFQRNDLDIYSRNGNGLPTFPNFRLGPVDGSICDSLGLTNTYNPDAPEKPNNPLAPFEIKIYPNPNNGLLTIGINQEGNYLLKVYNTIGQLVAQSSLGLGTTTINLQSKNVGAGLYFVEISNEQQQRLKVEKMVVAVE
jgi:hypothetical protein